MTMPGTKAFAAKENPMSHNVLQNVIAPEEIVWHETGLGPSFWVSDELAGDNYSTRFSAQLTKFGPGGGSSPHHHDYNHAFCFLRGAGLVQLGEHCWETKAGTIVKVPANVVHSLKNVGSDELVFLVIYDPPHVATD
ncbi:cupin domain-containing protein [Mycobacterium intracellulare]|nr:cupin domain protein [Mycobacterium intracellulare MIN_061107_1834]MCA2271854.1 cupin domain-containing protein [Mycobacterium intracellulare]MCA2323527.1 cupin domain-containing protein [Mycobacterium intracellulare]